MAKRLQILEYYSYITNAVESIVYLQVNMELSNEYICICI